MVEVFAGSRLDVATLIATKKDATAPEFRRRRRRLQWDDAGMHLRGPATGREEGAKAEADATRARTRALRNIASDVWRPICRIFVN